MSAETRKVLEMLAEGKIAAADAERLLERLALPADASNDNENKSAKPGVPKKFLRVMVERPGGDDINIRVPLNFVRSGVKLATVLPPGVLDKLQNEGIDPKLFSQQTDESVDLLHVDMETKSGKRVRVFCE
jgi:hypothetical protein